MAQEKYNQVFRNIVFNILDSNRLLHAAIYRLEVFVEKTLPTASLELKNKDNFRHFVVKNVFPLLNPPKQNIFKYLDIFYLCSYFMFQNLDYNGLQQTLSILAEFSYSDKTEYPREYVKGLAAEFKYNPQGYWSRKIHLPNAGDCVIINKNDVKKFCIIEIKSSKEGVNAAKKKQNTEKKRRVDISKYNRKDWLYIALQQLGFQNDRHLSDFRIPNGPIIIQNTNNKDYEDINTIYKPRAEEVWITSLHTRVYYDIHEPGIIDNNQFYSKNYGIPIQYCFHPPLKNLKTIRNTKRRYK